MSAPWMKFYPTDWRADPALRMCSIGARGLWIEMICVMHDADPRGSLLVNGRPITERQLAGLAGCSVDEVGALLSELEGAGVFSREGDVLFSRRMRRDDEKAERDKAFGRRGGNPHLKTDNEGVNPPVNAPNNPPINGGDKAQKPEARSQNPEDANASTARDAGAEKSDDRVIAARRAITATWQRLSNDPNRPSIDTGILNVWVASGFDPAICEAVVVSGLESALPRGKSVRSLKWFEEAVREAHDKRTPAKAPAEAPDWQALVARYSRSKLWPSPLGPAPGFAGCRVPLDILAQHGFERAA